MYKGLVQGQSAETMNALFSITERVHVAEGLEYHLALCYTGLNKAPELQPYLFSQFHFKGLVDKAKYVMMVSPAVAPVPAVRIQPQLQAAIVVPDLDPNNVEEVKEAAEIYHNMDIDENNQDEIAGFAAGDYLKAGGQRVMSSSHGAIAAPILGKRKEHARQTHKRLKVSYGGDHLYDF
jgi:hypothetical protein